MSATDNKPKNQPIPFAVNLAMSGFCGACAWIPSHPFELVKNKAINAAVEGKSLPFFATAAAIRTQPGGLYKGFDAGVSRQLSYTSFRIGLYDPIRNLICGDRTPTMGDRIIAGGVAGSTASFLSSPVEVALVVQTKSSEGMSLPKAMGVVYNKSGITGFWRGCVPLMTRAAIVGVSQIAFYDQVATMIRGARPDMDLRTRTILASIATGIFYAAVTMPVEVSRVILAGQQGDPKSFKYRNMPQTILTVAKEQGIGSLYRAYVPYVGRCTMHSIVCFALLEACKSQLKQNGYG